MTRFASRSLVLLSLPTVLLFCGCLTTIHSPMVGSSGAGGALHPTPVRASLRLPHNPSPGPIELREIGSRGSYRVYDLTMPSSGHNRQAGNLVTARYYRSSRPDPKGLVIILPIWGNITYPPETTKRRVLAGPSGDRLNVMVLRGKQPLFDWPGMGAAVSEEEFLDRVAFSARTVQDVVSDISRLIDWAERQPDIDRRRIGLVGYSFGALVGSLAMGVDRRLAAGVFVMGGGNLHQIFATCPSRAGRARDKVQTRFGWSKELFESKVEEPLAIVNPVRYAWGVDPGGVLYVDSARDECIPETAREELWVAFGRPERITIMGSHTGSFVSLSFLNAGRTTRKIGDFLHRRLVLESVRSPAIRAAAGATSFDN